MKHRREIDGLRALAILPVLLFHAGFTTSALDAMSINLGPFDRLGLDGGYFGVDIFFVISGFLITGIIVNELQTKNKFSIVGFYERRARRIMPALFVVMITMIPVGWLLLFSDQYKTFLDSLVSINFFVSNYFFLGQTGYFDPDIDLNPMLHTWSLAIEEQFYVFFPLILWLLWKVVRQRYWIPILSVIAVVSLVWANTNWYSDPTNTFYLLHFRAWELIAGALAAIHLSKREKPFSSQALSLVGIALLTVAILGPWKLVGSTMDVFPHPGFITLIPVVGTVLIAMFAGSGTLVNRVLSWRFFVGIGLISYSAYLWHQPLFAFFRTSQLHEPKPWDFLPLIAATLILAGLSWKFVENPFRNRNRFSRKQVFIATGLIMAMISGFAHFTSRAGVEDRRGSLGGQSFEELAERVTVNRGLDTRCTLFAENKPKCIEGENPNVLLWGDSYAMHLALALKASPSKPGFVQQTFSACAPVLGLAFQSPRYGAAFAEKCLKHNDDVLGWLARQPQIDYVILASPWSTIIEPDSKLYNRDAVVGPAGKQGAEALRETVAAIRALGKKPVIVLATPTNNEDLGQCVLRAAANNIDSSECDFKLEEDERYSSNQKVVDAKSGAPTFWLDSIICPEDVCLAEREGVIIYRDAGHLSREGSAYLGQKYDLMKQLIRAADRG
jgi:peptidoglycan/LPS O-acetylase OafA/YrhL